MKRYAVVSTAAIARSPPKLDDVTAASVPVVAIAALQTLRENANVKKALASSSMAARGALAFSPSSSRSAWEQGGVIGKVVVQLAAGA